MRSIAPFLLFSFGLVDLAGNWRLISIISIHHIISQYKRVFVDKLNRSLQCNISKQHLSL
jgi:hypothetical protein